MKHEARDSKRPNLITVGTKTVRPSKHSVFVFFCFIRACTQLLDSVMKGVSFFHNFGFLIRSSHTLHWRPHFQLWEMGEAPTERSLPFTTAEKITKRKFLFSNVQSLKLLSKKISGLSMISEIGKLRAREKIHYTSRGVVSKIMMFSVQTLEKKFKIWTAFL